VTGPPTERYRPETAENNMEPSTPDLDRLRAVSSQLLTLGQNGGFAVDPTAAAGLIKTVEEIVEQVAGFLGNESEKLTMRLPLGKSQTALRVSQHLQTTVSAADGTIAQADLAARSQLPEIRKALQTAMNLYRDDEAERGQKFQAIGEDR
jgi:hypothetical protein